MIALPMCALRAARSIRTPYVMGSMQVFLERLQSTELGAVYERIDQTWNDRARRLNDHLAEAGIPVRVSNLTSIWTVSYTIPSRYHWMLQYYMRREGLALSWVGTGRFIFSLNYTEADFDEVMRRMVRAGQRMLADGWWWQDASLTTRSIRRGIVSEMLKHALGRG